MHTDHIIPRSIARTGAELEALDHPDNLRYVTPRENLLKNDALYHSLISFYEEFCQKHDLPDLLHRIMNQGTVRGWR